MSIIIRFLCSKPFQANIEGGGQVGPGTVVNRTPKKKNITNKKLLFISNFLSSYVLFVSSFNFTHHFKVIRKLCTREKIGPSVPTLVKHLSDDPL